MAYSIAGSCTLKVSGQSNWSALEFVTTSGVYPSITASHWAQPGLQYPDPGNGINDGPPQGTSPYEVYDQNGQSIWKGQCDQPNYWQDTNALPSSGLTVYDWMQDAGGILFMGSSPLNATSGSVMSKAVGGFPSGLWTQPPGGGGTPLFCWNNPWVCYAPQSSGFAIPGVAVVAYASYVGATPAGPNDVSSGSFDVSPWHRCLVTDGNGHVIVGAVIEIGVIFPGGGSFPIHSGTSDSAGRTAPTSCDYYMGKAPGASVPVTGYYIAITSLPSGQTIDTRTQPPGTNGLSPGVGMSGGFADPGNPLGLAFGSSLSSPVGGRAYHMVAFAFSGPGPAGGGNGPGPWQCTPIGGATFHLSVNGYTPPGSAAPNSIQLRQDAYRRISAVLSDNAVSGSAGTSLLTTDDATGHTWKTNTIASGTASDPSLLIGRRDNRHRAIYTNSAGTIVRTDTTADGEVSTEWSSPASLGITGTFSVCEPHPDDLDRVIMALLDGSGNLKAYLSLDGGANWALRGTVATGQNFSITGRPALAWLGEVILCAYGSGNNLLARVSRDGGLTWGAAVTAATAGPYKWLSAEGFDGQLYLTATNSSQTLFLLSTDAGSSWALPPSPAAPGSVSFGVSVAVPKLTSPASLRVDRRTGRLWLNTAFHSDDNGYSWGTN